MEGRLAYVRGHSNGFRHEGFVICYTVDNDMDDMIGRRGRMGTVVTLIDASGAARQYDTGRQSAPAVIVVAGVEYVRVSSRRARGELSYREVDEDDAAIHTDTTREDN